MKHRLVIALALAVVLVPAAVWAPDALDGIRGACRSGADVASAIALGDSLGSVTLFGPDEQPVTLEAASPGKVTVFWFWSTLCPCVGDCEKRILALLDRHGATIRFIAVDPHPQDTRADIEALRQELGSPYAVYRDPTSSTVLRMGARSSASVAVFDESGVLRFRGAIDDDLDQPTTSYIDRAIGAILANTPFEPVEPPVYGCEYPVH